MAKPKRVFTKSQKVQLTEDEIAKRAIAMAGQHAELARVTNEKDETVKHFKATMAGIEAEIMQLAVAVNSGFIYAEVECEEHEDWTGKRVYQVRTDTGEEIFERPMTEEERQRPLDL